MAADQLGLPGDTRTLAGMVPRQDFPRLATRLWRRRRASMMLTRYAEGKLTAAVEPFHNCREPQSGGRAAIKHQRQTPDITGGKRLIGCGFIERPEPAAQHTGGAPPHFKAWIGNRCQARRDHLHQFEAVESCKCKVIPDLYAVLPAMKKGPERQIVIREVDGIKVRRARRGWQRSRHAR